MKRCKQHNTVQNQHSKFLYTRYKLSTYLHDTLQTSPTQSRPATEIVRAATVKVTNRKIQNPASLKCPPGLSLSLTLTIKHLQGMDVILVNLSTDIGVYGSPILKFDRPGQHAQGSYTSFSKSLDKLVAGWWYALWLGCPRAWWLPWSEGRWGSSPEAVGVHGGGTAARSSADAATPGQRCINPHTSGERIRNPARIPLLCNSGPRGILRIHLNTYPRALPPHTPSSGRRT